MSDGFGDGAGEDLNELFEPPKPLFSKEDFGSVLQARASEMFREIDRYPANKLLNTGTERLLDYFHDKYSIDVPVLDEQDRSVQFDEIRVDARGYFSGEPTTLPGFRYKIRVPFVGDPRVFNSRPSAMSTSHPPPVAYIRSAELALVYDQIDIDEGALKASHSQDLATIKKFLGWLAADADSFNSRIRPKAQEEIQIRRTKLLKAHGVVASLGIRLEKAGLPATYTAPQVQRKPRISRPKASTDPYVPEPVLETMPLSLS